MGMNPFLGYYSFMAIETLVLVSVILSAVNAVILAAVLARGNSRKDIQRMSQEMQDRSASSFDAFRFSIEQRIQSLESAIKEINTSQREQMSLFFRENRELNEKLDRRQKEGTDSISTILSEIRKENMKTMEIVLKETSSLTEEVGKGMEKIRTENSEQLEKMRLTVDEKLQNTLEERISKSFEQVTRNLEALYKSIGEMDKLAGDISSLNRMFSNVKVRGTWGEIQAENILQDLMTPQQYVRNYSPRKGGAVVEFAIKLPGKDSDGEVYLPIDSKFPKEDFVRYSEAVSEGNEDMIREALKNLRTRVLSEARDIRDKYIVPPKTTDFAILFVPTESLYAELLRMDGFAETLQDDYRVLLAGPTNFAALINSLQIGFKTLQVEKNTKRIWQLFKDLKTQFFRFGEDLEKTQNAIDRASDRINDAVKRNSMITGKLERIELPDDIAGSESLEKANIPDLLE